MQMTQDPQGIHTNAGFWLGEKLRASSMLPRTDAHPSLAVSQTGPECPDRQLSCLSYQLIHDI